MQCSNPYSIVGRTALFIGGSRGIGQAIAELFARQGAEVVICSRKAALDEAAAAIRVAGGKEHAIAANVGKLDEIQSLLRQLEETVWRGIQHRPFVAPAASAGFLLP